MAPKRTIHPRGVSLYPSILALTSKEFVKEAFLWLTNRYLRPRALVPPCFLFIFYSGDLRDFGLVLREDPPFAPGTINASFPSKKYIPPFRCEASLLFTELISALRALIFSFLPLTTKAVGMGTSLDLKESKPVFPPVSQNVALGGPLKKSLPGDLRQVASGRAPRVQKPLYQVFWADYFLFVCQKEYLMFIAAHFMGPLSDMLAYSQYSAILTIRLRIL